MFFNIVAGVEAVPPNDGVRPSSLSLPGFSRYSSGNAELAEIVEQAGQFEELAAALIQTHLFAQEARQPRATVSEYLLVKLSFGIDDDRENMEEPAQFREGNIAVTLMLKPRGSVARNLVPPPGETRTLPIGTIRGRHRQVLGWNQVPRLFQNEAHACPPP